MEQSEYRLAYLRAYAKNKWRNDPSFRIRQAKSKRNLILTSPKHRINHLMKANFFNVLKRTHTNSPSIQKRLGYSATELREHLESLFKSGMSWENYGKWCVDHIKPKKLFEFDSFDDPEFKKCWALENLQPLWKEENDRKHSKFIG